MHMQPLIPHRNELTPTGVNHMIRVTHMVWVPTMYPNTLPPPPLRALRKEEENRFSLATAIATAVVLMATVFTPVFPTVAYIKLPSFPPPCPTIIYHHYPPPLPPQISTVEGVGGDSSHGLVLMLCSYSQNAVKKTLR